MTPFHRALSHTLAAEGYYTDSGPTYRGIDRRHWPEWEGWAKRLFRNVRLPDNE